MSSILSRSLVIVVVVLTGYVRFPVYVMCLVSANPVSVFALMLCQRVRK